MASSPALTRRPRALFVTPASPLVASSGAEQRSRAMLLAMQRDWDVDVLQLEEGADPQVEAVPAPVDQGWVHVKATAPSHRFMPWRFRPQPALTAQVESVLGRSLLDYQLILGRYLWPVCQLVIDPRVPLVVDLDDWRYRVDPNATASWGMAAKRLRKALIHSLAAQQLDRFSAAFAVSQADADDLPVRLPTHVLPNVAFHLPVDVAPVPPAGKLLFVGSLWYEPNIEGIDWLLTRIWPAVRQRVPDAQLQLIGVAHPRVRANWALVPGVSAPGVVDDLHQAYQDCSGVVAPLLSGGGSNIKVLEAMAHARPCIVTGLVHTAFATQFTRNRHYLVANDEAEFVDHMVAVLSRPQEQQAMATAGRDQVLITCSLDRFTRTVRSCLGRFGSAMARS
jgi:glycosyltransferase involved in cell wall biosynthesis